MTARDAWGARDRGPWLGPVDWSALPQVRGRVVFDEERGGAGDGGVRPGTEAAAPSIAPRRAPDGDHALDPELRAAFERYRRAMERLGRVGDAAGPRHRLRMASHVQREIERLVDRLTETPAMARRPAVRTAFLALVAQIERHALVTKEASDQRAAERLTSDIVALQVQIDAHWRPPSGADASRRRKRRGEAR